ncbi:MAG TPA: hypothetical protein VHS97_05770 [Isosphaeraceae bacterium]|nr:hypothetical protein [Isosphaeraceae bacterium]
MEDTQRTLVILLTMHRSGSSVATSILNRLGMSLGSFKLLGATPSNPHGHFEAIPILELNMDVQKLVYGFAQDLPESEEALDGFVASQAATDWPEIPAHFLAKGRSIIENLLDSGKVSGFKDPRTVLLWPFWERVLTDFPTVRVAPVALLRSPHEIAMSLCSRSLVSGGVYAYWDCLDMTAIHFRRLKKILDDWREPTPFVRFGSSSFLDDLAETARHCGLVWDAEKATEMLDAACIHYLAARVPHEAQHVYDSLCGQCALIDHQANQDRLNADSRVCERMAWRRVRRAESTAKSTLDLLAASQAQLTQSQVEMRHAQDELHRAHEHLHHAPDQVRAAHDLVRDTGKQLREAHDQVRDINNQLLAAHQQVRETNYQLREAYDQLREAYDQLGEAHDQARNLSQNLRETYEHLHRSQEHNTNLVEVIRQANLALEQSHLDAHNLRHICDEQRQNLGKFEEHPLLGAALRGRRRLLRALDTMGLRSAG